MNRPTVLLVPQAFKGSLTVGEVAAAMTTGAVAAGATPEMVLGSDGGDGLIEALRPEVHRTSTIAVTGPLGRPLEATIAWLDAHTAVIESRMICGLSLLSEGERDPFTVTSRGVGEAIAAVVADGALQVMIGLGGSAMVDGGWGMATAVGWEFRDAAGRVLVPGRDRMSDIRSVAGAVAPRCAVTALCDVSVPFAGPAGAVLFAEQKGAGPTDPGAVESVIDRFVGLRESWRVLSDLRGAGSAGGLGFGLAAFAGAQLVPGSDWMLDRSRFEELLDRSVLVLTAEGRFDATSLLGKLTGTVVQRAAARGVPAVVLAPGTDGAGAAMAGLTVVSGGGVWSAGDIVSGAKQAVARALGLLGT